MSLTEKRRNKIKEYMLDKIENHDNVIKKTCENFKISPTTVYRYLDELQEINAIKREKRGEYSLVENYSSFTYHNENLEEDIIYIRDIKPILEKQNLPYNVMNIWYYAFTEMFNNAIEHSESKEINCSILSNRSSITILIKDSGVGIFNKIKEYYNYELLDDAVNELFKGKLTTDSKNHSGEGIFFTSRIMDTFGAISSKKCFTHNNFDEIIKTLDDNHEINQLMDNKGTIVIMSLANRSHKEIKEVFDMFTDIDNGFNRTSIPMKNIFGNNFPVSRSQAKRLYNRLNRFDEVELDFADVDEIGQGFAHELFVKFARMNPNVKLNVVNENAQINKMIQRVKNTR